MYEQEGMEPNGNNKKTEITIMIQMHTSGWNINTELSSQKWLKLCMNSRESGQLGVRLECFSNRTASFGSQSVVTKTAHNKISSLQSWARRNGAQSQKSPSWFKCMQVGETSTLNWAPKNDWIWNRAWTHLSSVRVVLILSASAMARPPSGPRVLSKRLRTTK